MTDSNSNPAFAVQADVRGPWRRYLDALAPMRPALHRYCCRLTGNVWDGEDLMQDALLRVFGLLGKIDADLENPRAYFIRTATHLWIDEQRRATRHRAWQASVVDADEASESNGVEQRVELRQAASALLKRLPPRERAAVLMREVLDLSAKESATLLQMTEGAVKAALHRGRERLQDEVADEPDRPVPSPALVDQFLAALASQDMATMQAICLSDLAVELVGGACLDGFEASKTFFGHAHMVFPPEYAELARKMVHGHRPALARGRLSRRTHRARLPHVRRRRRPQRSASHRRDRRQNRAHPLLLFRARHARRGRAGLGPRRAAQAVSQPVIDALGAMRARVDGSSLQPEDRYKRASGSILHTG